MPCIHVALQIMCDTGSDAADTHITLLLNKPVQIPQSFQYLNGDALRVRFGQTPEELVSRKTNDPSTILDSPQGEDKTKCYAATSNRPGGSQQQAIGPEDPRGFPRL